VFNNVTGQYEYDAPSRDWDRQNDVPPIGANIYFNPNNVLDQMTQRGIELASERTNFIEYTQKPITSARGNKILFAGIIGLMIVGNFLIPGHS